MSTLTLLGLVLEAFPDYLPLQYCLCSAALSRMSAATALLLSNMPDRTHVGRDSIRPARVHEEVRCENERKSENWGEVRSEVGDDG